MAKHSPVTQIARRIYSLAPRTASLLLVACALVALFVAAGQQQAWASPRTQEPGPVGSPLHPTFVLLDASGENVLASGLPVSTRQSCGACHDTQFIEEHSFHADLGLSDFGDSSLDLPRAWDSSRGLFGKWDPLTYRVLSPTDAARVDLTTPEWLKLYGARVPGGGPATTSRSGDPLLSLSVAAELSPENAVHDKTGALVAWDWQDSGVMEMNCFLCHLDGPNTEARTTAIEAGEFGWANTATLLGTGIVSQSADGFLWQPESFDADGKLKPEFVQVQDPGNENCAACHGVVHTEADEPLLLEACSLDAPQTATTGQVISGARISNSGLNLQDKASLSRAWDVHAERGLQCTDCHYALNNPLHAQDAAASRPAHLTYDPRRLEIGEYLERPDHNFARGESAQISVAPELKGSMRRCESCHAAEETHSSWLPYAARHMQELACESCHVPQLYAPAVGSTDWTVVNSAGQGRITCRGLEGADTVTGLVTGFQPVLMQRTNVDGDTMLAPYNLISSWYWVSGANESPTPVPLADLQAVYLDAESGYLPEIVALFDADGDAAISDAELVIDSAPKQEAIRERLAARGLENPRIEGQVQPYSINHTVARAEWAISDCHSCHDADSVITQPMDLGTTLPGGVVPTFVSLTNVAASGELSVKAGSGKLSYRPVPANDNIYVFGRTRVNWVDWLGAGFLAATLLAVAGHGALRFYSSLRHPHSAGELKKVYMYQAYERFWHWLQTVTIILLIFTGLIIHRPDLFGIFSFPHVVTVHNVLAAILVINAGLSLFWHLAGGEIKQFIPRPYGFFDQAIEQTRYYLRGIFRGDPHPFEKTRERHMNPLQQVTYFGILNVLLPLQILTGALMWGVQRWPAFAGTLGGLPVLAPLHSLVAWLFATFIVAHVYLTTTGHQPLSGIKAMVTGWEEVEGAGAGIGPVSGAGGAVPGLAHASSLSAESSGGLS